jgi:hypothetical protein
MIPVTTRLEWIARDGLAPGLRFLLGKGIPGVVLEAPTRDVPLDVDVAALREMRAKVVGEIAPLRPAPSAVGSIASADRNEVNAASAAIRATAAAVAPLGCKNVVAVVGAAGLHGEDALRDALNQAGADPVTLLSEWRVRVRAEREGRVEGLCRVLHGIATAVAPQRLLLLPGPDPLGCLDSESAGWVLEDLKPHAVGLALDSGWAWAGEAKGGTPLVVWLASHASRLGFLFISDHDSLGCGEILPGAGRGDLAVLRDAIGRRMPRAVRPDPAASRDDVLGSVELAARILGAVGDVVGW